MTIEAQFATFTGQEGRAWQAHRGGAEAALLAAGTAGRVSAPFWPQAELRSATPVNNAVSAAVSGAATGRLDTLFTA